MGAYRTLTRKIDLDLLAQVQAGRKPEPKPLKRQKVPRHYSTYRAYKRNLMKRG